METKTIEEVLELAKVAKEKGVRFKFLDKNNNTLAYYTGTAIIYKSMSISEMYSEISKKCKDVGFNVNEDSFNKLKSLIEDTNT